MILLDHLFRFTGVLKSLVFSNFYLTKTVLEHIKTHFQKAAITASTEQILDCFYLGIEFSQSHRSEKVLPILTTSVDQALLTHVYLFYSIRSTFNLNSITPS